MAPPIPVVAAATGLGAIAAYYLAKSNDQPGSARKAPAGNPPPLKNVSYRYNSDTSVPYAEEQSSTFDGKHDLDALSSSPGKSLWANPEDMLFGCF